MSVLQFAAQAAEMKSWPQTMGFDGSLKVEVKLDAGRTQLVNIVLGYDRDSAGAAKIWSLAAGTDAVRDPWALLRHNAAHTYGHMAVDGDQVHVVHVLLDEGATMKSVGKAIYWVAKAADELEQGTYGSDTL